MRGDHALQFFETAHDIPRGRTLLLTRSGGAQAQLVTDGVDPGIRRLDGFGELQGEVVLSESREQGVGQKNM